MDIHISMNVTVSLAHKHVCWNWKKNIFFQFDSLARGYLNADPLFFDAWTKIIIQTSNIPPKSIKFRRRFIWG